MMAWSLPLDERRKLRYTFVALDKTSTGTLHLHEVRDFLLSDSSLDQEDVAMVLHALDEVDIDHDGDIHYSDFLAAMMCPRLKVPDDPVLHDAFRRFDTEHLGYLTQRQLEGMLGGVVDHGDIEHIFEAVDGNHDGHLDVDEFVAYAHGSFKNPRNPKVTKPKSMARQLLGRTGVHLGCFAKPPIIIDKFPATPQPKQRSV